MPNLGHGSWVGSVRYRSCTTSDNGRVGSTDDLDRDLFVVWITSSTAVGFRIKHTQVLPGVGIGGNTGGNENIDSSMTGFDTHTLRILAVC